MSPGVPYVSVRSNDVLNGSLDLVLRLCTHVDAVWRVLRPGREVRNFLLDPLVWTHTMVLYTLSLILVSDTIAVSCTVF